MAPEILSKSNYNGVSVDIYALGIILFEIVSGASHPFGDQVISSTVDEETGENKLHIMYYALHNHI